VPAVSLSRSVRCSARARGGKYAGTRLVRERDRKTYKTKSYVAEREGFEPPDPCGSTVFKTAAFDHSATSPLL
jgi:hypothetical protein